MENIQPTVALISRLRYADCLTDTEARLIRRDTHRKGKSQRDSKEINAELLQIVRSFNVEARFSNFTRCLRQSNANVVEKVAQNGGGRSIWFVVSCPEVHLFGLAEAKSMLRAEIKAFLLLDQLHCDAYH